ncbi:MAG: Lrp/AsnC family transcriptional regulator [Magnetococcales bacterium]|nr:Lrp/AsnC family transcriptional regulator [Magnetococcales bacterium]
MSDIEWQLLNSFQHNFPMVAEPYKEIGSKLGISEDEVLFLLQKLNECGMVSRVGCVLRNGTLGVSTLAAVEVAPEEIDRVAELINSFSEVNHNYERENAVNLWFVVTACSKERLMEILTEIENKSGSPVLMLPMEQNFHINLGFPIH